jgi:hypothetical protein
MGQSSAEVVERGSDLTLRDLGFHCIELSDWQFRQWSSPEASTGMRIAKALKEFAGSQSVWSNEYGVWVTRKFS